MRIDNYCLSYIGKRANNEDAFIAFEINKNAFFAAVADGMGGSIGGEIASNTVITSIKEYLLTRFKSKVTCEDIKTILEEVFNLAQKKISEEIIKDSSLQGMGTTLTAILILDNKFVWGNIGDSRIYRINKNSIEQLTEDHSYIQDHANKHGGEVSDEFKNLYGNYLLRIIDGGNDVSDIFPTSEKYLNLGKEDIFLLCSDGLIVNKSSSNDQEFLNYVLGSKTLAKAAENLTSFAFYNGSTDNITVILLEFGKCKRKRIKDLNNYPFPPENANQNGKKKKHGYSKYFFFLVLCLIVLGTSVFLYFTDPDLNKTTNIILKVKEALHQKKNKKYLILEIDEPEENNKSLISASDTNFLSSKNLIVSKGEIDSLKKLWKPLDQSNYQLPYTSTTQIIWNAFPDKTILKKYEISLKSEEKETYTEVDKPYTYLLLGKIDNVEQRKEYELTIKAILVTNDTIKGNKVKFTVK